MKKQLIFTCSIILSASLITACKKENVKLTEQNKQASGITTSGMPIVNKPSTNKPTANGKHPLPGKGDTKGKSHEYYKKNIPRLRAKVRLMGEHLVVKKLQLEEKKNSFDQVSKETRERRADCVRTKYYYEYRIQQAKKENNTTEYNRLVSMYKSIEAKNKVDNKGYEDAEGAYQKIKEEYSADLSEYQEYKDLLDNADEADRYIVGELEL